MLYHQFEIISIITTTNYRISSTLINIPMGRYHCKRRKAGMNRIGAVGRLECFDNWFSGLRLHDEH